MAKKKQDTVQASPAMEKDWRGESDARILSEAEGIRNDPKRLEGARCHLEHAVTAYRAAGRGIKRARKGKMRGVKNGRK